MPQMLKGGSEEESHANAKEAIRHGDTKRAVIAERNAESYRKTDRENKEKYQYIPHGKRRGLNRRSSKQR